MSSDDFGDDDTGAISFLDAQNHPDLLNPADNHLNNVMSSKSDLEEDIILVKKGNNDCAANQQVEVVCGKQREEEANLTERGEGSTAYGQRKEYIDIIREAQNRKHEEEKEQRRIRREAEETKKVILQAIETKRILQSQHTRLTREGQLCSSWSAGRSGSEAIGRQISGLWQSSRPSAKEVAQRETLIKDAEEAIQKRWPGCGLRLVPFGSTRTGLFESRSDIDLTLFDPIRPFGVGTPISDLELPSRPANHGYLADSLTTYGIAQLPDYYSVRFIASALRRAEKTDKGKDKFTSVTPITHARVPIVKFNASSSGLSSDINVNDCFGNVNSDMLAAYCEVDSETVRPFLYVIKKWASRRGINDPAGKSGQCSLNSYTICLIAIQFLQLQEVVPNLQSEEFRSEPDCIKTCLWQKPPTSGRGLGRSVKPIMPVKGADIDLETGARRFDTTFIRKPGWKTSGDDSTKSMTVFGRHVQLGELLKIFFIWLSDFNFEECGISIRLGQPFRKRRIPKSEKLLFLPYLEPPSDEWNHDEPIQCQDPFIVDRNTCAAIKMEMRQTIIEESRRAKSMLEEHRENVSTLLSDLLVDSDYDKRVEDLESMMQALDPSSRSIIDNKTPAWRARSRPKKKNRGRGEGNRTAEQ